MQNVRYGRNRNLSGRSSSGRQESVGREESERIRSHKSRRLARRVFAVLLLLIAIAGTTLFLVANYVNSAEVEIIGDASRQPGREAIYEKIIADYLADHPLAHFRFFVKSGEFADCLKREAPEVAEVVSVNYSGILTTEMRLSVKMREPVAKWGSANEVYYVDSSGGAFSVNYFDEPELTVVDENNLGVVSDSVASTRFLSFVGQLSSELDAVGYDIEKVTVPLGMSREVDVLLKEIPVRFKMSVDRSPIAAVRDLGRVDRWFKENKGGFDGLNYIDLRVPGKAYWK